MKPCAQNLLAVTVPAFAQGSAGPPSWLPEAQPAWRETTSAFRIHLGGSLQDSCIVHKRVVVECGFLSKKDDFG